MNAKAQVQERGQVEEMKQPLTIAVLKDRYQTSFMTPRTSRHRIKRVNFTPLNKINSELDGVTVLVPQLGASLIHAHNRIPAGSSKLIMSFESHLPRRFGLADNQTAVKVMQKRIEQDACRRIIGMSHYARRTFLKQHADTDAFDVLSNKLMVRHPNCELGPAADRLSDDPFDKFVLTFVGGHFGRKGGCVSVRVAELANERGLPIEVNIISSMAVGGHIWTDPSDPEFFEPYLKLLDLPNVNVLGSMPNAEVRELLGRSHFCMLPTFADTFGYSAIEAMAEHTPVIGTDVCALPEFIEDGLNGLVFHLDSTPTGDWINPGYNRRGEKIFADHFRDETERLAQEITSRLEAFLGQREAMLRLRRFARLTAESMFAAPRQGALWDDLYSRVAEEKKSAPIELDPALDVSSAESVREAFERDGISVG